MPEALHPFERRFSRQLTQSGLVQPGDSVVLAVSGGLDSMAMLHCFSAIQSECKLSLAVAHVNHQLREDESDTDQEFVTKASRFLGMECFCSRVDTYRHANETHRSIQEAARELRYDFFEEVRLRLHATSVATAHQADDNAETVLLNALRGAGVRGLAGIPLRRERGNIIRPLLFARRQELQEYARERGIRHREDSSNQSIKYKRNYVRHSVIPLLRAGGETDAVASLNRLSAAMRQLDALITAEVQRSMAEVRVKTEPGETSLHIGQLRAMPRYLQGAVVLEVLRSFGGEIDSGKVRMALALCELSTGSRVHLSKVLHVYRDREHLVFIRPRGEAPTDRPVTLGESVLYGEARFTLSYPIPRPASFSSDRHIEFVDANKLGEHLLLRSWHEGDWFIPLGMKSKKKVSDFFVDEKVPFVRKKGVPILESNGSIVWVCGQRLDDRFKISADTTRVVRLEYNPSPS